MYVRSEQPDGQVQGDNGSQIKTRAKLKTEQKPVPQVKSVRDQSYSEEQDRVCIWLYWKRKSRDNWGPITLPKGSVVIFYFKHGRRVSPNRELLQMWCTSSESYGSFNLRSLVHCDDWNYEGKRRNCPAFRLSFWILLDEGLAGGWLAYEVHVYYFSFPSNFCLFWRVIKYMSATSFTLGNF
jgi:hypothetical protein